MSTYYDTDAGRHVNFESAVIDLLKRINLASTPAPESEDEEEEET